MGGPTADYYVALARLHMMKEQYDAAEGDLKQATQIDHQVCNLIETNFGSSVSIVS